MATPSPVLPPMPSVSSSIQSAAALTEHPLVQAVITTLRVNDREVRVPAHYTVLQACEQAGVTVPRFCYHEDLPIAGNCRICLVEVERSPKPVAACAFPVTNSIVIYTDSALVRKAREAVLDFVLANHPLDCPICDQGGICDLQDEALTYGTDQGLLESSFKAGAESSFINPLVETLITRCIACTRCVRYSTAINSVLQENVPGRYALGTLIGQFGRGAYSVIGTYTPELLWGRFTSPVAELCPVGALTSRPVRQQARSWELSWGVLYDITSMSGDAVDVSFRRSDLLDVAATTVMEPSQPTIFDVSVRAQTALDSPSATALGSVEILPDVVRTQHYWVYRDMAQLHDMSSGKDATTRELPALQSGTDHLLVGGRTTLSELLDAMSVILGTGSESLLRTLRELVMGTEQSTSEQVFGEMLSSASRRYLFATQSLAEMSMVVKSYVLHTPQGVYGLDSGAVKISQYTTHILDTIGIETLLTDSVAGNYDSPMSQRTHEAVLSGLSGTYEIPLQISRWVNLARSTGGLFSASGSRHIRSGRSNLVGTHSSVQGGSCKSIQVDVQSTATTTPVWLRLPVRVFFKAALELKFCNRTSTAIFSTVRRLLTAQFQSVSRLQTACGVIDDSIGGFMLRTMSLSDWNASRYKTVNRLVSVRKLLPKAAVDSSGVRHYIALV